MRINSTLARRSLIGSGAVVALTIGVMAASLATNGHQLPHAVDELRPAMLTSVGSRFDGIGPATFVALDPEWAPVEEGTADSAYLLYGDPSSHAVKVFVGEADGPVSADPCSSVGGPTEEALSCEATAVDGGMLVTSTLAFKVSNLGVRQIVGADELAEVRTDRVQFERNARMFHDDGSMTSVTEVVGAPKEPDPATAFDVDVKMLQIVASSKTLIWN